MSAQTCKHINECRMIVNYLLSSTDFPKKAIDAKARSFHHFYQARISDHADEAAKLGGRSLQVELDWLPLDKDGKQSRHCFLYMVARCMLEGFTVVDAKGETFSGSWQFLFSFPDGDPRDQQPAFGPFTIHW